MGGVLHPVVTLTLTPEQASRVAAALHFAARDLFRANMMQKGTNDPVAGFDPRTVAFDGKNEQSLTATGGSARLKWSLSNVVVRESRHEAHATAEQ